MKRTLLISVLALLLLSGCAGRTETAAPTPAPAPLPTAAPEPTPEPTPEETFPFAFSQELLDEPTCAASVTALGVDADGNWIFHLKMENRSDEIQSFRFLYQSINGLTCEDFVYRLRIGETMERSFRVFRETLESFGMEKPVQWSFTLRISSPESDRAPLAHEEFSVCPFGEAAAVRYEYAPTTGDMVVMDNACVTVYVTGYSRTEEGLAVNYVAVNKSEAPIRLLIEDGECLVNGLPARARMSDALGGFATLLGYVPLSGEFDPDAVKTIDFTLSLADPVDPKNKAFEELSAEVMLTLR